MASSCISCGQQLEASWKVCPTCGEKVPQGPVCDGCGQQLQADWKACPGCGRSTQKQPSASLDVGDSTVHTLTQNVTNITYADQQSAAVAPPQQIVRREYCNSCGRVLPDDHFLCLGCRTPSCMDCRSPSGTCLSCNPYRPPSSPGVVRANITSGDATISWDKPADDGGKPIRGYTVSIPEIPGKHADVAEDTQTVMHDIPEGGPYTFVVTARNEIGLGPRSESSPVQVFVTYCSSCGRVLSDDHFLCSECKNPSCMDCRSPMGTCLSCDPYRPPGAPGNVEAEIDRSDATVSWSKPTDDGGKPIFEYTVGIQELPGKHVSVKDGTSSVIADLPAGGPYTFTVTATNEIGAGPKTESLPLKVTLKPCDRCEIVLDDDPVACEDCGGGFGPECIATSGLCIDCHANTLPGSPGEVTASLMLGNVDDIEVSWRPSDDQGGSPVTEYVVRCVEDSSNTVSVDASSFVQSTVRMYSKYCLSCGTKNTTDLQFCTECGETRLTAQSAPDEEQRYTTAVRLLAIGESYSFTVSAVNSAGESAPSPPSDSIMRKYSKYCLSCGCENSSDLQFCNRCGEIQIMT